MKNITCCVAALFFMNIALYKAQRTPSEKKVSYEAGKVYASEAVRDFLNRNKLQALFARSVMFYYLQQVFGDIPYPDTTDYQVNQRLSKTPEAEALQRIEADLTEAIDNLPNEYRSPERIYPNRKSAQLLLAKVNMLQNKWSGAETILKSIIQDPRYIFQNDIKKVFDKSGAHIIWQLKPINEGWATTESLTYYFEDSVPYSYALTQDLVNSFSDNDLREQNWIREVDAAGEVFYSAYKYKNFPENNTEYSIVFRLEEAYLLLAEALAQQNKTGEALPYLNALKQRAGISPITGSISKEALLNEILSENRKEFFTEMGNRFFTLKRMGKLGTLIETKPNWKSYHNLWPLPQQELLLNPNLKPQNPGY